jgi:signal transduction histidine kinase
MLDEVHALVMPHLQFHRVEWQFSPSTEELAVRANADELKQVFLNISLNAIEAMQTAGGSLIVSLQNQDVPGPEIDLSAVKKIPGVGIAFKDTGPGIPEEALPRIFDPFFTTKETGNGLGLAICYDIVKRLNGQIAVESQLGYGTTFTVWLPVAG